MRVRPAVPPMTPPTMVLGWAGAKEDGTVLGDWFGIFAIMEEFDELGVEEGEIPATVVVETEGAKEDELLAVLVEKFGMKGGDNAETGAVFDEAGCGFIFVIVPFINQTP